MTDPLTDAANAISKQSPKIRSFAQLAAQRIEADEAEQAREAADLGRTMAALSALTDRVTKLEQAPVPPSPPTPPSTGTHVGNGFILFRYGSSWSASPVSGYERYGVVVVGYGNDGDAGKLTPAVGLGYRTPVELEDVANAQLSTGGVTLAQARANGWLLKDAAGNELHPNGYPSEWCGNVSLPEYAQACAATYNARAQATGVKGFFLDNVVPTPWFTGTPANLGGFPFDTAYLNFLAVVRTACPDLYFLANCGPGGASWWTRLAPWVDGLLFETFTGTAAQLQTLQAGKAAGKDVYALSFADPASSTARSYAQAFASVWNQGEGGGFGLNLDGADPWNTNWTSVIT